MNKAITVSLFVAVVFSWADYANAQTKGIECRKNVPGSCGGGGSYRGGGSSNDATGQLLGIGAALIIQGLSSSEDESDPDEERKQMQYERERAATDRRERQAKVDADRLFKESANADGTNPFGKGTQKTDPAKDNSSTQRSTSLGAKFADPACISFTQMGRDRFTEDAIRVLSKCAVPVAVLVCFKTSKLNCDPSNSAGWQVTRTIVTGEQTLAIATGSPPYKFEYFVCDMTAKNGKKPLCLRPKA